MQLYANGTELKSPCVYNNLVFSGAKNKRPAVNVVENISPHLSYCVSLNADIFISKLASNTLLLDQ